MNPWASSLIAGAAGILFVLGSVHLLYTWGGTKLHPRDARLLDAMRSVSPVISRETTMWRAWVGFNASHAFGALLFGAVYGYLATAHAEFLGQSTFLRVVGIVLLAGYVVVAKLYWFRIPFSGIVIAASLYLAGLIVAAL